MDAVLFTIWGRAVTLDQGLWILGVAVVVFLIGLLIGRAGRGSRPAASRAQVSRSPSDDAFMKGLTHMMADHTDQAIEEFTRAVTLNSDTVETYVVLGNLFRQKGEIERAVRIRQSIIARPNLASQVRLQALYDLGLDYRKGGFFNRATDSFQEVLSLNPECVEAFRQLVLLYEETRDWEKAFDALKRLDKLTGEDSRRWLAHYKTEAGKEMMAAGHLDKAEDCFSQAMAVDKSCLDAYLHLGDLELARGRNKKALNLWRKAVALEPVFAHLVVSRVTQAEDSLGDKTVDSFLEEIDPASAEITTLIALAQYHRRHRREDRALELMELAVRNSPNQLEAHRLRGEVLLARGDKDQALAAYAELLKQIDGDWASFQCEQCGFVSPQLTWKCPRCHHWDTMKPWRH